MLDRHRRISSSSSSRGAKGFRGRVVQQRPPLELTVQEATAAGTRGKDRNDPPEDSRPETARTRFRLRQNAMGRRGGREKEGNLRTAAVTPGTETPAVVDRATRAAALALCVGA